ncbi:type IV pilus assembly protein PilC [Pedobacter sp. AK017]|uniref:type II secretion system F family protein n=1 Tax=Pedobacter sp. AK017 TaxID=2723073 RepID=UPI00160CF463|nr:type II secretion system F family protein [Pedobacter sp. AK017]MBB5440941.1 type IV pilus assembly protein PilC [Pedobacter sp. AK017]
MVRVDISKYQQRSKTLKKEVPKPGFSLGEMLSKDISIGSGRLSDKKKDGFFFELSTLLQSGIDLKNSLDLMTLEHIKGTKDKHTELIRQIKEKVIAGQSMALAVQSSGKFSDYDFFSIQIGEETGNLAEVMKDLAVYYRRKIAQHRKIVGALTYPLIVLGTSAGAVFFMLRFVVPMFSDVFKRFGGKLPWITQVVISFSAFVERFFIPGFLLLALLAYLVYRNRNGLLFRRVTSDLVLKIPVLGELVKKIYLARFCNTMRLLVSTRIPLLRAIAMAGQTIVFYPLEVSLKKVEQGIMEGRALHECLSDFSIYPPKLVQLIKVGEEINKLDYFFESIAGQYVDEIEHQTNTLSKLIEPLIIIFLGLVVGFILVAMYLPMFEMSNSF